MPPPVTKVLRAEDVKAAAKNAGFALVGLARARPLDGAALDAWLDAGYAAGLDYMHERRAERLDPARVLPGAQTVIALALPHHPGERGQPAHERSLVARYARGADYHNVHRKRLKRLRRALLALEPGIETYACVDTGPVMEKMWAEEAGLGFIGKNGCLIHPALGSWFTLSVMFIDRAVDRYDERHENLCGDCTLCLRACPTGAFPSPGVVDANRCIAYHTIENRAEVPDEVRAGMRGRMFGCDVCQEVCPFNRARDQQDGPALAVEAAFAARALARMTPEALLGLSRAEFDALATGSPLARPGYGGMRRNAALVLGAARKKRALSVLQEAARDEDPVVAGAAGWAVARTKPQGS